MKPLLFFCFGWTNHCAAIWHRPRVLNLSPHSPTGQKLWSLLSPCTFVPYPDPVSHEHPMNISLLQFHYSKVPAGEGTDAPARTKAGYWIWRAAETSPALGEEALVKRNIPKPLVRLFFFLPTWCKNTARASAGTTWAWEKLWTLAGIRWLVLNTFTWRRTIKRTKPRREGNLTLSTSSSVDMSLGKQPISNSWF